MNNISEVFVTASVKKYRFPYKGQATVEDLWDLSVEALDSIYKTLKAECKRDDEDSLLTASTTNPDVTNKIEIVKYIVQTKLAEAEARTKHAQQMKEKEKYMEILAEKQDEALRNLTIEELQAKIASM